MQGVKIRGSVVGSPLMNPRLVMTNPPSLLRVFEQIDRVNAADPRLVECDGRQLPFELVYGHRMSACLDGYEPRSSEALQVAARGHHIARFEVPRIRYPEGRSGYLQWRTFLYRFHADRVAELMGENGYERAMIERVRTLIQKRGIKTDPEVQILEDVICLVFLSTELDAFSAKHPNEKVVDILQKTWSKMSKRGQQAALALPFSPDALSLIQKALRG